MSRLAIVKNRVEPLFFFYMLSEFLSLTIMQSLIYNKLCLANFNETICSHLTNSTYKSEETFVQQQTSHWILYINGAMLLPSTIVSLFLGSFGDSVSRKMTIILPIIGTILGKIGFLLVHLYEHSSMAYLLIGQFLNGLCGGYISLMMAVYSYTTHVTDIKSRTVRIGILESMIFFSGFIGLISSGIMLEKYGYVFSFSLIIACQILALLYTLLVLEDIVPMQTQSTIEIIKDIYKFKQIKDLANFFLKSRRKNERIILLLGVLILLLLMFVTSGEMDTFMLYLQHRPLSMSLSNIGYFLGMLNAMRALPLLILLPLLKKFSKTNDVILCLLGYISKVAGSVMFGLSKTELVIFFVPLVAILQNFPSVTIRSLLSSFAENNEQGKLFTIVASLESFTALLASLSYNSIYAATVAFNPGIVFFFGAGINAIGCLFALIVWTLYKREIEYRKLEEVEPPPSINA